MNKPHRQAAVIKAWADGADIQYSTPVGWKDWVYSIVPEWSNLEYRIKPKTRTCRVALVRGRSKPQLNHPLCIVDVETENEVRRDGRFVKWLTETIEYEV